MQLLRTWLAALALASFATAAPVAAALEARDNLTPLAYTAAIPPEIVHEFPIGTWVENLVIRQRDGNAVATILSAPEVYLISTTDGFEPILLAEFPGNLGVLGIVELGHDVFYVAVGNWSAKLAEPTPGSWSLWEIDLNGCDVHHGQSPKTQKIVDLPEAGFLNGMAVLNPTAGTVIVADSLYSGVWRVNVRSGELDVAINHTSMAPQPELATLALGINALSIRDGYLYYDNTDSGTFYRMPIDVLTGQSLGPAEAIVDNKFPDVIFDDFTLDFAGNIFIVSGRGEVALLKDVAAGAAVTAIDIVAGNVTDLQVTGHTAAKFGTSSADLERGSLYATTSGGALGYIFGNLTTGGMLVRYDTAVLGLY
ncbi:uncharacterized protein AB675_5138 [Cyphellophora attinorum]|uniref:SMP-30/Gluconolactonase/LRE-like region domain-containing protein n=1 Tax=Cyphellophora attinorum TaxID=1664694 RepID=A0A0N1P0Q5_9EURO|nr:uncharacterized protein AB675_5138 [Phialophora attinorum]KPI39323.1 hypothetical protein AB675_5138 [Phialophora attinorum]